MERELRRPLYRLPQEVAKDCSQEYAQYRPWVLGAVLLWAALHDRPLPRGCRSEFGKALCRERARIARHFGDATSFGGGLGPLPARVRGLPRVRSWVWAKPLINGVRIVRLHDFH